jgi:hypothetical protein
LNRKTMKRSSSIDEKKEHKEAFEREKMHGKI